MENLGFLHKPEMWDSYLL